MPQISNQCVRCLNDLVLKVGQCEACGAPPLEVFDQADVLPLQFLKGSGLSLAEFVERAKLKNLLIDWPVPDMSHEKFQLFLAGFKSPISAYADLVKGKPPGTIGLVPAASDSDQTLDILRRFIFAPIREAFAKARAQLVPLEAEFNMLEAHLVLKKEVRRDYERLLQAAAFEILISSHHRERLQTHLDYNHKNLLKVASDSEDGFQKLRALQRYAHLPEIDALATVLLYLRSGEARGEFLRIMDALKFAKRVANPNGTVRPLSDGIGLELCLQLLGWRTFRRQVNSEPARPIRALIDMDSIRNTIKALEGRHPVLDAYIQLSLEEGGQVPTPGPADELAKVDADFAFSRLLVQRPMNLEDIKAQIVKSKERKALAWVVGWPEKEFKLPYIEQAKIDDHQLSELAEAVRTALAEVIRLRKPILSAAMFAALRTQAIENPKKMTEWERTDFSATLKNDMLNLLVFHEADSKNIAEALGLLTAPAETFWLRSEIQIDEALFVALTGPDTWGYRVQMFLDACARLPEDLRPDELKIEAHVLPKLHDWFVSNKPGEISNLEKLWAYVEKFSAVHGNAEALEQTFLSWLRRMGQKNRVYAEEALKNLTALSRARLKNGASARTFGAFLKSTVKPGEIPLWTDGLEWLLREQAHARLVGANALAMKMLLEQEELLSAYHVGAGEQNAINLFMDIVLMHNLEDFGLFSAYFAGLAPMVSREPMPSRLKKLRSRATSQSFIENRDIQKLLLAFVDQWPDPEVEEEEKQAKKRAAERTAERAHQEAMQGSLDNMIDRLEAAHQENIRMAQTEMQENLAKASARLGAALAGGGSDQIATAQQKFQAEINAIQEEGTKKIMALSEGLAQAKALMKKLG